ncbi:DUF4231 domain-containing protein [Sinorhizobium meliloti]|nr:DUF4231 domain-containing protein [Sinorhizobium meliloti]MDX0384142.1 DUF4231 domain-containing protein [Sinorhizobium meliloti]
MNVVDHKMRDQDYNFLETKFKEREAKLLEHIAASIDYYVRYGRTAQRWQRCTATLVMVLSTLAPLLVAGSTLDQGLGLPDGFVPIAAFTVTLLLSFTEGVRRIFRFEQRWTACYTAKQMLKRERERYRFARIGLDVGGDAWKANFAELRRVYDEVTGNETKEFFAAVQAPVSEPEPSPR